MNTIVSVDELLWAMPRITTELSDSNLEQAIFDVERFYVKDRIGDALFIEYIQNPLTHQIELEGGVTDDGKVIAGLKQVIFHLAYAHLMYDNLYVSAFGTTRKRDDYSEHPSREDIYRLCHFEWTVGSSYMREFCAWKGIKLEPNGNNDFFNEFV